MITFDYNPLAVAVIVSYVCPECSNTNNECITIPSPDLTAETARESVSADSMEIQCEHCGKELNIELATSYNAGFGIIHDAETIISVEEELEELYD